MKSMAYCTVASLLAFTPPALAQYDTSQLEQSADYERNRILVRSTMRQKKAYDARRAGVTAEQVRACSNKERFRTQHGADDPRVQLLFEKCQAKGL